MAFAGLRGTGDWGTDERPKNFREMILWSDPNGQTPLTALMAKMRSEKTNDPEYAWWEEKLQPIRIATSADLSASSTTVTVASGALNLVAGDVLMFEKNATDNTVQSAEIVTVASVTNDTTFVITRAQAGTTGQAQASGSIFMKIGNAFAEGTRSPGSSSRNPTKLNNYCQIFKTAYELTRTARDTKIRTGDPLALDRKRKSFDHSVALEYAWFFGSKYEIASSVENNKPKRFTGGLRSFLSSNVKRYTTTPTEDSFIDFLAPLFDFNTLGSSDERIMLCGRGFATSMAKLVRNNTNTKINFTSGVSGTYLMKLNGMDLPFGRVGWRTHPLFNVHGTNSRYNYAAFILNPPGIRYRPFMDTKFKDNIQENDADTQKGQWITEAGIEVNHEWTMGYLENFIV